MGEQMTGGTPLDFRFDGSARGIDPTFRSDETESVVARRRAAGREVPA